MTITRLIEALTRIREEHGDLTVQVTWETVDRDVTVSNLHVLGATLWIDADHNSAFPDVPCACWGCVERREEDLLEEDA